MSDLKLVIFDVDGTLVDSQADILGAMKVAFERHGMSPPSRKDILSIVGLSLDVAIPKLAPEAAASTHKAMVEAYKGAYMQQRLTKGSAASSPLYPGARAALERLHAQPETLLGIATGKSRRGLDRLLEAHALSAFFVTEQVADHHPSKPHPAMLETALSEAGVSASAAVMIGDTAFDMEMAKAAGVYAIGVSWGYHDRVRLSAADLIVDRFEELDGALAQIWG